MAVKGASAMLPKNDDFVDVKSLLHELAKERAAVVFTVLAIGPEENHGNGPFEPVRADILILTGRHAGEIYPNEKIFAGGIRNKLTEIGSSVVGRIDYYDSRRNPGLQEELPGDVELAEAALAKFAAGSSNGKASNKATAKATTQGSDESPPF